MTPESFDLVVIGAGPAGEKAAVTAAVFGKRVAIVERSELVGGAVANTGTLPSKTLRETALALSGLRSRSLYGVDLSLRREATIADLMFHEKRVTAEERSRILGVFAAANVTLYHGAASFEDPRTIRVRGQAGERLLSAGTILIATGSAPYRPPEFRFEDDRICDSDEILHLDRLPSSMAVVGAGVIGSEYACTFAALGIPVHVLDGRDTLLPFLDSEISQTLAASMEQLGVIFHWNERVTKCEVPRGPGEVRLDLSSGKELTVNTVLVAAGRTSCTEDLNLRAAGITPGQRGLLTVDAHFRTESAHIYAVGDVIGFPALAATSAEQARVAMCHAFDLKFKRELSPILPIGIYTIPEVSMVGETEESLAEKGIDYIAGRAWYRMNARGYIIGDQAGFLKLLFRREDMKLLGVHVLGEHATELVHIGLVALLTESGWDLFNRTCFNYPTLGTLYQTAAYEALAVRDGIVKRGFLTPADLD